MRSVFRASPRVALAIVATLFPATLVVLLPRLPLPYSPASTSSPFLLDSAPALPPARGPSSEALPAVLPAAHAIVLPDTPPQHRDATTRNAAAIASEHTDDDDDGLPDSDLGFDVSDARIAVTFTHVINPYVGVGGDAARALEARLVARSIAQAARYAARRGVRVEVVAAVLEGEERAVAPPARLAGPPLNRTFADAFPAASRRARLPFLRDVLESGARAGRGEFLVFTNADIVLQRHFYISVAGALVAQAPLRALTVNRRTVVVGDVHEAHGEAELNALLRKVRSDAGQAHPGHDCFVFPREWALDVPAAEGFVLGAPVWGCWLRRYVCEERDPQAFAQAQSLGALCTRDKEHWTVHVNNDRGWKKAPLQWYWNAMWLLQAARSGHAADPEAAVRACRSRNPCKPKAVADLLKSPRAAQFVPILNETCRMFRNVRLTHSKNEPQDVADSPS